MEGVHENTKISIVLTGTVDGAEGRARMVCVPLRRYTPPSHEGGNGWDYTTGEKKVKNNPSSHRCQSIRRFNFILVTNPTSA